MENAGSAASAEDALAARIGSVLSLDAAAAQAHWRELDRFLTASVETGIACSPPQRVDDVWHAAADHEAFERYCSTRFGQQIQHDEQDESTSEGFGVLRAHAEARFGALDSTIWDTTAGLGTCVPKFEARGRSVILPVG